MRPYLAIVKDSFREAFHSRVLWIVLLIITLFLIAVSPLTYRQTLTVGIRGDEVHWNEFMAALDKANEAGSARNAARFASLLSTASQTVVREYKPLSRAAKLDELSQHKEWTNVVLKDLQEILKRDDLYQSTAFSSASLRMEGKELLRREKELSKDERQRLNRLLLESSFGDAVNTSPSTSLQLRFGWFDMLPPFPISKTMLVTAVRNLLPFLVDKGLLAIGLFIAILVTAPAIPHTFETGSLHLLLSKPVSRSLLYISKFFGSCAFVLLCATYLFIGLYFLLGARWAVWEPRLLWCIPIYTFVFAVYYSVAALAGLFWRNAIVSILVAVVFWALCFTVGFSKVTMEASMNKYRIEKIVPADKQLLMVDGTNTPRRWDSAGNRWEVAFLSKETKDLQPIVAMVAELPPIQGPVYDPQEKRVVAVMVSISNGQQNVVFADPENDFKLQEGPASPLSALDLINEPNGQPLLFTQQGMYRPMGDLSAPKDEVKILGYKIPFTTRGPLRDAGPTPALSWDNPFMGTFGPDGTLYTYSRGTLQRYSKRDDGRFAPETSDKSDKRSERRGLIAAGKTHLVVGFRNGVVQLRDPQTLKVRKTLEAFQGERLQSVISSNDGQWIALITAGKRQLWLLEDGQEEFRLADVSGQGEISAARFSGDKLLVADYVDRLNEYQVGTWKRTNRLTPPLHLQTIAYHYLVNPIYFLCPKPGEFYRTITYLLVENNTPQPAEGGERTEEPAGPADQVISNPWQPVYSSAAFMAVMLLCGCFYMEWQEF